MTSARPSAKRRLALNAAINWVGTLAQMVAVFFVSPILVRGLGDERYGAWAFIESILAYLTLFDLGIGAAVVRYIARFEGGQDQQGINRTFSASVFLFSLAGLGVLAVASLFLGPVWGWLPVPSEHRFDAWWLFALLAFNLAVGLPMGVFAAVLDGLQRYVPKTLVRMVTLVVRSVAMLLVVRSGGGLAAIALTVTVIALIEHLVLAIMAFAYLPGLRFAPHLVDRETLHMIGGYSVHAFVAMIAGRISFQSDALVIGAFLPLSQITYFALASRLTEHVKGALRSMTTVLTPHISQLEGQNDFEAIRRVYIKGTRYVLWLIIPVQLGIFFLGKPFFRLWIGPEHAERCYPVLIILAAPLALVLSQSIAGRILYGVGKVRGFSRLVMIEAISNLGLSLLLIGPFGIVGVAIGTMIPSVIMNIYLIYYACSVIEISLVSYLRSAFVLPTIAGVSLMLVWVVLVSIWPVTSWIRLLAVGTIVPTVHLLFAYGLEIGFQSLRNRVAVHVMNRIPSRAA
ncbi:flippase [Tautonia sp. JC769]|uniref:flippase n=1 Tax=Tautonia sp. JC769 TaxID=3232135 RepID=UPI003458D624